MNILFTTHRFNPDIGGIEVNSEILAAFFFSQGHDIRLVTQSQRQATREFPYPVYRSPPLTELIQLYRWADLVYQNNIELGTLWPSLFVSRPTVISVRTWIRGIDGRVHWNHRLKKLALQRANAVIAISEAIRKDSFLEAVVIGNPYRSDLFRVLPDVSRQNSVVFLGRFVSDKGADLLIRAFAETASKSDGLTLIGAGPDEAALRASAARLGVVARFTGPLDGEELVRELNCHQILVVPSLWEEPFGNVVLEGMACGCAVLGSNGGGLPDAIGPAGLLFDRGSVSDLAAKLQTLLSNPNLINSLRKKASLHLQNHREEVVSRRYLDALQAAFLT